MGLDKKIKEFNSEISFFARTFFFVYTGMLMTITSVMFFIWGLVLTLVISISRYFAVRISLKNKPLYKHRFFITSMMSRGFVAAVLAYFPLAFGIPHALDMANLIFVVIFTTVVVSTLVIWRRGADVIEEPTAKPTK
jgi:NhaP-type Na+/H+ or K+/H+ antiporter